MLHIGHQNYVQIDKILVITGTKPAPLRRSWQGAEDGQKLIDCTSGKRTESLIHLQGGYIVTSSLSQQTLVTRILKGGNTNG